MTYSRGAMDIINITTSDDHVWTFNTKSHTWTPHKTSGEQPGAHVSEPVEAMTAVEDHAYVLVQRSEGMYIYQLDLQTWCWRCLPLAAAPFTWTVDDDIVTALVQVRKDTCLAACTSYLPDAGLLRLLVRLLDREA